MHVRFADEAVCIGPPQSRDSYLNIPRIIAAAEITNADAIHPGYGFLSENSKFSAICRQHGIKFIGATPEQIDAMGDKASAKATMKAAGVPTIPGSEGLLGSIEEAKKVALEIGYPVIMKATAGGGGKGMRIVWKEEEMEKAFETAKTEAGAAFGNDGMYMEKFIEEPRHIEIQVAGDQYGKACHLSERDCSIQRRHQKLVEESPSPFMTPDLRKRMGEAAIKAALAVKYEGVGTVEFLVDKNENIYFIEVNPASFNYDLDTSGSINTWYVYYNSNLPITNHYWDFGDGFTSTLASPTHIYANGGYYTVCHSVTTSNGCNYNFCSTDYFYRPSNVSTPFQIIVYSTSTGLEEKDIENVKIYPNPLNSEINITGNIENFKDGKIMDLGGRIVKTFEFEPSITITELNSGLYVLDLTDKLNNHVRLKFVKQ